MIRQSQKQTKKRRKSTRRLFLIVGVLMVLAGAAAYIYVPQLFNTATNTPQRNAAKKKLSAFNVVGDEDVSVEYTRLVAKKDFDAAKKVFTDRISDQTEVAMKVALLEQWLLLAQINMQNDHALEAATRLFEIRQTHENASQLAGVYDQRRQYDKAVEMITRAIALVEAEDISEEEKRQVVDSYQIQKSVYESRTQESAEIITKEEEWRTRESR